MVIELLKKIAGAACGGNTGPSRSRQELITILGFLLMIRILRILGFENGVSFYPLGGH
jgi:hypothetical protein